MSRNFGYPIKSTGNVKIIYSSEDEIDILLHGTEKQRQKLMKTRSTRERKDSSSEDEFEKQMSKELNSTVELVQAAHNRSSGEKLPGSDQGTSHRGKYYACQM